jgi:glycosyltransferase involved in cell wall biosynthesis
MNENFLISIVVITYNKLDYLKSVLTNLRFHVRLKNVEIIVVNDGSTDDTRSFLKNNKEKLNFEYVNIEHSGSAKARNTGINLSKGDYILFIDNDIIIDASYIEKLRESILLYPDRIHAGNLKLVPLENVPEFMNIISQPDYSTIRCFLEQYSYKDAISDSLSTAYSQKDDINLACWWAMAGGGNICFPKKVLYEIELFDENFKSWGPEDTELCYRAFTKGYYLKYNSNSLLYHLEHPRNITALKESMVKNISLLYKKYKTEDILAFLNFFNGMISLDELNKVCIKVHQLKELVNLKNYHISLGYYINKNQVIKWGKDGTNSKV